MPSISFVTSWSFCRRSRIVTLRSIGRIGAGQASKPLARQDDLDDVAADLVGDGLGQLA